MSKVIQVVLSDDEYKAISEEAVKQDRKLSQMARRLMMNNLKSTFSFEIKGNDSAGVVRKNDNRQNKL